MINSGNILNYLIYTANLIADSRFGNKMVLKGGSVLMSRLIELNRTDLGRLTRDLDIHCDKREVWIDFYTNIESILNKNDRGYVYKIEKRRSAEKGLDTSDSLVFTINDCGETIKIKIDMNIKSNKIITVDYSPVLNMNTYDLETMISDKVVAISSDKIFRRVKDVYDLAVLLSISNYSYKSIKAHIRIKHSNIELKNMLISSNMPALVHAYEKYDGIFNKPSIYELVSLCSTFVAPLYLSIDGEMIWDCQSGIWRVH